MLTDFGLAKDVESESQMTRSGMTLGTPAYMPPEQAGGRLSEIDERSDVYALGATLYEMLTLKPPFEGTAVIDVIQKVLRRDPSPVVRLNPAVDRDLETICLKCLEKEPARRYRSAKELSRDLARFLEGSPILARPPSSFEKAIRKIRKHKGLSITITAAVLLLLVGSLVAVTLILKGKRKEERAVAGKRDAEVLLEKNKRVANVLLGSHAKLGGSLAALKRSHYDSRIPPREKRKKYGEVEGEIRRFAETVPDDSASLATLLAVKGWLTLFGRSPDDAYALFAEARKTDPEVGWGYLFEAMAWLKAYLDREPLPSRLVSSHGIELTVSPAETPAMVEARERFQSMFADLGSKVVGVEEAARFQEAMEGFRGIREGNFEKAEVGLTKALDHWSLAWMEEEILLARAKVRYMQKAYDGALADLETFEKRCPGGSLSAYFRGAFLHGKAQGFRLKGEDPMVFLRRAEEVLSRLLQSEPDHSRARGFRGGVRLNLAQVTEERGGDPEPLYRQAEEDLTRVLEATGDNARHRNGRGLAWKGLGSVLRDRGGDPSVFYEKALADFDEALRLDPDLNLVFVNRGELHLDRGLALEGGGIDPREVYREALQNLDEALRRQPDSVHVLSTRGSAHSHLAEAHARRGLDPAAHFERAIKDFGEAIRLRPDLPSAIGNRAAVYGKWGRVLESLGKDPLEVFGKAIADCDTALGMRRVSPDVLNIRGEAYAGIGDRDMASGQDPRDSMRKAIDDFTEAVRRNPRHFWALNNRGTAYSSLAQWELDSGRDCRENIRKAIDDFTAAHRLNPQAWDPLVNRTAANCTLALVEAEKGGDPVPFFRAAIEDATKALRKNPESAKAYLNRGTAHQKLGEIEASRGRDPLDFYMRAAEDYGEGLKRNPEEVQGYYNRGTLAVFLGDAAMQRGRDPRPPYRQGVKDCEEVIRRDPGHARAHNNLGVLYQRLADTERIIGGDPDPLLQKAIAAWEASLKGNPGNWQALANIGSVQRMRGNFAEAVQALEKALALTQGRIPVVKGWLAQARAYAAAPELGRKLIRAEDARGRGDFRGALALLEEAVGSAEKAGALEDPQKRKMLSESLYTMAKLTMRVVQGQDRSGPPSPEEKRTFTEKGLQALRRAFETGWKNLDAVRKNPLFAPLHPLPVFKALMAEQEKKGEKPD
ncbi:MAG: tetratricopeptide repeat protein [Planctomycetota bacterium]|jgi:serine/threonine-protein kinase